MKDPGKREDDGKERAVTDGLAQSGLAEQKLMGLADSLYRQFQEGIVPHISLPSRTKANIEFSSKDDVWVYGDQETVRSVKTVRGAKTLLKTVHLSEHLVTPSARFLGVQPSDIVDYNLSTDKLTDKDLQALRSELTDPRFANPYWDKQIRLQLDLKKKAEQQAFAGKGLDYVTRTYLPDRLSEMGII